MCCQAGRAAGVPPNQIKASLKAADSNREMKTKDIYNKTAQVVPELKQGLHQNEAFIAKPDEAEGGKDVC